MTETQKPVRLMRRVIVSALALTALYFGKPIAMKHAGAADKTARSNTGGAMPEAANTASTFG